MHARPKKLVFLEWARGIAALLVVLHHETLDAPTFYAYVPFNNFFYFGKAGVDFFFVLSGFIIYYVHSNDNFNMGELKRYFLKRFIRIYPIFWLISFGLLVSYIVFSDISDRNNLFDILYLIKSFLLFPMDRPPLLSVSWTLAHEMFFYMVFVVFILNKRFGFFIFTLWGILVLYINLDGVKLEFPISFYLSIYNIEFIFGVFIAYICKKKDTLYHQNLYLYFGVLVFILNGLNQDYNFIYVSNIVVTIIYGVAASVIIYSLSKFSSSKYNNKFNQFMTKLGGASYVIYLVHLPLLSILHRIILKWELFIYIHPNLLFIILAIIVMFVGIGIHLFLEKYIVRYLTNKFIVKKNI